MGDIIIPEANGGADRFFNIAVKAYINSNNNGKEKMLDDFAQYLSSKQFTLHLSSFIDNKCQIVVFNEQGKKKYFEMDVDENLNVKSLNRISKDKLSEESNNFINSLDDQDNNQSFSCQ